MQRCPNCRARYRDGDTCHRCGMELTLLLRVEQASECYLMAGIDALAVNDPDTARVFFNRSFRLTHDALAASLLAFCSETET